ncbi:hypothetical protein LCGC14_0761780 [marine sediment metagenome]|uniref:Uncharacterized protein n=1 Tax=marine sediment metagenome TaxID=412755 RepID=A0A0F9T7X5_9ZZZZ|nr:MarR family transcriptional regulator [bacterium]
MIFTIPDGAYLPPELIYLLPKLSGAKLKTILAILYNTLQIGASEPLSFSEIESLTGLSHQSVVSSLQSLTHEKLVERHQFGNSYVYNLVVKFLDHSESESVKLRKLNGESQKAEDSLTDSSDDDSLKIRQKSLNFVQLLQELRQAGVYLKTAQKLIKDHSEDVIRQQLKYYKYAILVKFARSPGWLVLAIKEEWPAPLGYKDSNSDDASRRRYAEWTSENEDDE